MTRDQDLSKKAMDAMGEVVTKYPDSEYANDARNKIDIARDQLAGKEMQIGRYYLERREYLAAVNRFRDVVEQYQTTRQVEEALQRLTEAYHGAGHRAGGADGGGRARAQFPRQRVVPGQLQAPEQGRARAAENKGSWISRAFRGDRGLIRSPARCWSQPDRPAISS